MTNVLLLEPYLTGSHSQWAEGYSRASELSVQVRSLPGRFWKWRMHGAAVTLAEESRGAAADVVLCSDMLDLATFLGLARDELAGVPAVLYMHENQLAYPSPEPDEAWTESRARRAARRDEHYPFINLTSVLAADVVAWNSRHNRDSFLDALPAFLRSFPDYSDLCSVDDLACKSVVLPVGLDLAYLDEQRPDDGDGFSQRAPEVSPGARGKRRPRVVWNHRWEHDKDPDTFFAALRELDRRGVEFDVALLGESFVRTPPVFEAMREHFGPRLVQFGHAPDRADYARQLWESDVVVSTARHEFFGVAVCEAVHCGCLPVLPNSLAYPELVPPEHSDAVLYDDFSGLVDRLERALDAPNRSALNGVRASVGRFDWSLLAPAYDELIIDAASRRRRPGSESLGMLSKTEERHA